MNIQPVKIEQGCDYETYNRERHRENRDELNAWRAMAVDALEKAGGSMSARELAKATDVRIQSCVQRARKFPRYIVETERDTRIGRTIAEGFSLHPHLMAHMVTK